MRQLPFDFSRCLNAKDCPLQARCRRALLPPKGAFRIPYMDYPPGEDCEYFIPDRETKNE